MGCLQNNDPMALMGQSRSSNPEPKSTFVRSYLPAQPIDATQEGQLAINAYDGLPNARPIVFGNSPRNQLSHNTIFSAAPCQHEVTDLSSYTLYLFPLR